MADAWKAQAEIAKQIAKGAITPGQLFGTREHLKNNYLYRMAAAVAGITGIRARKRFTTPTRSIRPAHSWMVRAATCSAFRPTNYRQ
jgi:hypothetical protein